MSKKWATLYKYISSEHAADIIQSQQLRMSDGSNFNDPFELLVVDKKEHTEQHINGIQILCLTNSFKKKLMWSHYADSHKGLCLAVKVPAEMVYYVCYTSERLSTESDIDEIISKCKKQGKKNLRKSYEQLSHIHKAALIKDQKWAYEKEYRIVCSEDQPGLIHKDGYYYFPVKIERIYLGCRFNENSRDRANEIIQACLAHNVELKQMCRSQSSYALVPEKLDMQEFVVEHKELATPF